MAKISIIHSIINQTFSDFEFIINNYDTNYRTKRIFESLEDSRIHVLQQNFQKIAKSLNQSISIARGEYIAIMDAFSISLPHRLEKQFGFMCENKEIALLGSNYEILDIDGRVKKYKILVLPRFEKDLANLKTDTKISSESYLHLRVSTLFF